MTDTLLRSLRDHMLDEEEPLAGLLRKCLLLGAETGSNSLREWARKELNGYGDNEEVPEHRRVTGLAIKMNSISGNTSVTGQTIDRLQMPPKCWEYVSESIEFKQPVEELERLAGQKSLSFTTPGLAYAQTIWNQELGPHQTILQLSFVLAGSTVAGIVGQIRTRLVDLVADLTADTPLSELPRKEQVDAAVRHRIEGDIYNTTFHGASGPLAIGKKAMATTEGLSVEDALRLLDGVQKASADVGNEARAELLHAIADLRSALEQDNPDTGEVVKKAGRLRAVAESFGTASLSAAAGGVVGAITELAITGAFG